MTITEKLKTRDELIAILSALKATGSKIGYTSGVFDILHPGHADYLQAAKSLCDVLVVGINSDSSVKKNKGELRPICPEKSRAHLIAALESVDFVFVFSETNNNQNIAELHPDVYVKAGDYSKDSLSSAPLVESYGGEVKLVPLTGQHSSTDIIEKIGAQALAGLIPSEDLPVSEPHPVAFIDRDGTIIREVDYLHEPDRVELLPGAIEGLKKLQTAGMQLVLVTNQPGIGLGYLSEDDFFRVTLRLFKLVSKEGVRFSKVYFCPHSEADGCQCRKPAVGLIERAKRELFVDAERSFVIGDTTSDLQLAAQAGLRSVLVETGKAGKDGKYAASPTSTVDSLNSAADFILPLIKTKTEGS